MKKRYVISLLSCLAISNSYADIQENFPLKRGWNLVGFPKTISSTRGAFSNKSLEAISGVYKYNPNSGWLSFNRNNQRDVEDFSIDICEGVWIKCEEDNYNNLGFNLQSATELKREDNLSIENSWNLLALPSKTVVSPSLFEESDLVWKYSDGVWKSYKKDDKLDRSITNDGIKNIKSGEGFWVKSSVKSHFKLNDRESKLNIFSTRANISSYIKEMIKLNSEISEASGYLNLEVTETTSTNLQEEEVYEADIVKTNKTNLFVVDKKLNSVYSYNLNSLIDGDDSKIEISGVDGFNIEELFLTENKLLIISTNNNYWSNNQVNLKLVDASSFEELENITFDGGLVSSRIIDNSLFLITSFTPTLINGSDEVLTPKIYKSNAKEELYNPDKFYAPVKLNQNYSTVSLSKIDLDNLEIKSSSILGDTCTQYVSKDSIYLVSLKYPIAYSKLDSYPRSMIYKFSTADLTFKGNIFVDGEVLNQFSLSEVDNTLRVATHIKANSSLWADNTIIYTIKDDNETLSILDSLQINEYLTGIRFLKTKAFFTVDTGEFYTIDLSDVNSISRADNIFKIDATSLYFHPVGEDRLLSIGRDLDEYLIEQNLSIKLFDINDSENITLLDSYNIGDKSYSSEAESNHKAFTMMSSDYIFSLPVNKDSTYLYVAQVKDDKIIHIESISSEELSEVSRGVIFKNDENRTFIAFIYNGKVKINIISDEDAAGLLYPN